MEKTRCPLRLAVIFKNYFFVWFNFTAESVNCSFGKSRKNIFAIRLTKKTLSNTSKITATSEKFIGIAQGFFESYRYRFSTERFIVPITNYRPVGEARPPPQTNTQNFRGVKVIYV